MKDKKSPIIVNVFETEIGGVKLRCTDARQLHSKLENATPFHKWILRKIKDFEFQESEDFRTFMSESSGGRPATEYTISIDMAKELCMLERSDIGRATRKYFIECERQLIQIHSLSANSTSTLKKDLFDCIDRLKRTDNQFEEQLCHEMIERFCSLLKMPQPAIELLETKKEKKTA